MGCANHGYFYCAGRVPVPELRLLFATPPVHHRRAWCAAVSACTRDDSCVMASHLEGPAHHRRKCLSFTPA